MGAVAVDFSDHRTGTPARPRSRTGPAAGVLRDRGLRPLQRADPGAGLPQQRAAVTAATPARRSAGAQARVCRAVAAQCQCPGSAAALAGHPATHLQEPFHLVGAAARGASPGPLTGRPAGAGVHFCGPCARQDQWLVLGIVLGKLGAGESLPPAAGHPAQWPQHHRAICSADQPARDRCRGPALRAHRAQTVTRTAHPLCADPGGGDRARPVDAPSAGGASRTPSPIRPDATTPPLPRPGKRRTAMPTKSPPITPTRWCAPPASC